MAPKTRLTVSVVGLTAAVAVTLSALYLHSLTDARFQEVAGVARMSALGVRTYLVQRLAEKAPPPPGATVEEAAAGWRRAVREDAALRSFLVATLAGSPSLVEIFVSGADGEVLTGSNPARIGSRRPELPDLEDWLRLPLLDRLRQVFAPARDLEHYTPLGVAGSAEPVLGVHVVVSTALVREAVAPQIRRLGLLAVGAILLSGFLAAFLASLAGRPLERVSQLIDLIAEGKSAAELPPEPEDRELAALQSKLALLGEKVRAGRREDRPEGGEIAHLVERLQDAVLLFDARRRLVIASQAADRYLSAPRWELIGRRLEEVFPEDTRLGALLAASARLQRSFRDRLVEVEGPEGTLRAAVSLEILTDFPDRRPLGAVVTLRDAESRRQLESQIDSSLRREAFGRLLQGVAHEIKNPLNAIYTHLQLLQLNLGDRAPEARREMEVIGREIKTLDRMVVSLLDLTRPLELRLAETDLGVLAREIASLETAAAEAKGVRIRLECPDEPIAVSADRGLLRQAVLNVVKNAVECMKEPGEVTIRVERAPDGAVLSVADQGPGIPEEIRDKIFRLYFTTKGRRGSGIGLAMAWRIAQLHNARLDFTTSPEGTTFRFVFPA